MRHLTAISLAAVVLGLALAPSTSEAQDRRKPSAPVACDQLADDLLAMPFVKAATSIVTPASGPNVGYCQVNLTYGTNPQQNINIRVGLPLNSLDGGTGGVQGAWNGRTQGIGGGGC